MADESATDNDQTNVANGEDTMPQVGLLLQYVKDLSFENPNAPAVFQWQGQPRYDVQFNLGSQMIGDDTYETVIKIEVRAESADKVAYAIELSYAGLFAMRNVPEDQIQPFLFAEAPRLLFPFARRVISDATRDGGFPPLVLDPIDFAGLYMANFEAQQAEALAAAEPGGAA